MSQNTTDDGAPQPRPPSFLKSLSEFGVVPLFFASLIGIGSTTELLQFFFGDLALSEFLAKWLETWSYYNDKIRLVLQPVSDAFARLLERFGLPVVIDSIWISFFWLFLLPGVAVIRLVKAALPSYGRWDRLFVAFFMSSYAIFALLLALSAGAFPSDGNPFVQAGAAYAPIVITPLAGLIAAFPLFLFAGVVETFLKGIRKGVWTFLTGLATLFPGWQYFKMLAYGFFGVVVPVFVLAIIPFPQRGQGLAVYYVWLLVLGVVMICKKPSLRTNRPDTKGSQQEYTDMRPAGMFILGGFFLTCLVLGVDYALRPTAP